MEKKNETEFTRTVPEVDNIYELVVVAALRARQLNHLERFPDPDKPRKIIDRALNEACGGEVEYDVADRIDGDAPPEETKEE